MIFIYFNKTMNFIKKCIILLKIMSYESLHAVFMENNY
jgi:hypothetical protein